MPWLDLDGTRLHYERVGAGPAVVLVHGGMCRLQDWSRQLADLARDHTVVAPDLRGHGQSEGDAADCTIARYAADINALIDRLALAPALLVGHSMASRVVAEAAGRRPDNARGVILLDGSRSHGGLAAREPDSAAPALAPPSLDEILDATIGPYAAAADRAEVRTTMSAARPALIEALVETMRDWDLTRADEVFAKLKVPLMAIQSTYHDAFTPRRSLAGENETTPYLDFLRGARPDIATVVLPDTGHFSMRERPDRVAALIRQFDKTIREKTSWRKSA